ncbi:hypothetical protein BCAH1134_C0611 (plasmid) [Bacillus cereus AH1134]|nr:hypothetical protein BCAH1134_C0611 [Bacillus cereus AH1134]
MTTLKTLVLFKSYTKLKEIHIQCRVFFFNACLDERTLSRVLFHF